MINVDNLDPIAKFMYESAFLNREQIEPDASRSFTIDPPLADINLRYDFQPIYHMNKFQFTEYINYLGGRTGLVTLETIRNLMHESYKRASTITSIAYITTLESVEVPRYLTEWLLEYYIGVTVSLTSQKD